MVLLDIEGTTTPIDFVYDNLFVYARENFLDFLKSHREDRRILTLAGKLKDLHGSLMASDEKPPEWDDSEFLAGAGNFGLWLMRQDSKNGTLKEIQGLIWQEGYAAGKLKGEVYPDVLPALRKWADLGIEVCIYSSGSVLGQKLLFSTTDSGDLTDYISGFYDTSAGAKIEELSYHNIAADRKIKEGEILFLSDRIPELEAARNAGVHALLVVRDGNCKTDSNNFECISSFDDLTVERV